MIAIEERHKSLFAQTESVVDRPIRDPPDKGRKFEPEDFSKACRFPNRPLACYFSYDASPRARKRRQPDDEEEVTIDHVIDSEEEDGEAEREEPSPEIEPNFATMVKIIRRQIAAQEATRSALEEMAKHVRHRFVAFLAGPFLQLNGIYVMKRGVQRIDKIWGEGPAEIEAEDVRSFWAYNLLTKQFDAAKRPGFTPKIDAVSF
jgi:hypothetical protein